MDSAANTWNINPSELIKGSANCGPYLGFENHNSNDNDNDDKHSETSGMGFGQDGFDEILGFDCEDVDHLLSQELKDLDIPLIPRANNANNENDDNDDAGNVGSNDMLALGFGDFNGESYSLNRNDYYSHKRAPSGTAIFGFHKHNKTLSISNWQKSLYDLQEQEKQLQQQTSSPQLPFESVEQTNADGILGQVLLKQQEELRVALEKQQEVNKKLEKQLEANRAQQEHLQRALGERESANRLVPPETASSSPRSPMRTPAPHASNGSIIGDDGNIIITSNSTNGSYKFPPPENLEPLTYVPGSQTAINGSPSRRTSRNRNPQLNGDLQGNAEQAVAMGNYLSQDLKQESEPDFKDRNDQAAFSSNSFSVQNRIRSPVSTRSVVQHLKKESTISTVSTIPQHLDDNDNSDFESGGLLGLGIQAIDEKRTTNESYSLRPPPLTMPPVQGSGGNSPIPKRLQFPQKHTFQHTPAKNSCVSSQQSTQSYYDGIASGNTCLSEGLFKDPIATPQLKPPSAYSSHGSSDYKADYNELLSEHKLGFKTDDQQIENNTEPESRFIMAKTPSPVLKSQGRFEGSSPQCDITNVSPLKITRKPTTLPRGSIDRYVKELPDKLFECEYHGCGKIFKRRYNIRSHIQTHLEDRPYACDFEGCDKAFVRNHDLVRHKKSHAEKCYACPCGKKFNREDALIVHRSRMICSGGKKYENVVIKKSPRKRGRPKKDGSNSTQSSPIKQNVERSGDGYLICKMEEQLRNEMEECGLLRPPQNLALTNNALLLSPSASSGNSAMGSPR